ncbi:hypothetical protein ABEB36_006476 [Hypothenemus hampei]|uniref:Uncharacterized protein n=1 Tax=Hypothenemus hampei TaxID=57062 RepID=A0ABD1ER60_HYPHA
MLCNACGNSNHRKVTWDKEILLECNITIANRVRRDYYFKYDDRCFYVRWIKNKKGLECFGDGSLESGISYGRNVISAILKLKKAFHNHRDKKMYNSRRHRDDVHDITSTPESGTFSPKEALRAQVPDLPNYRTAWNRDLNSARNIILFAAGLVSYKDNVTSATQLRGQNIAVFRSL